MAFPIRALVDPLRELFDLLGLEPAAGFRRRHALVVRRRAMRAISLLSLALAGNDGESARFQLPEGVFLAVEPQAGLSLAGVGTVAGIAMIRKDRADVAVVVDGGRRGAASAAQRLADIATCRAPLATRRANAVCKTSWNGGGCGACIESEAGVVRGYRTA